MHLLLLLLLLLSACDSRDSGGRASTVYAAAPTPGTDAGTNRVTLSPEALRTADIAAVVVEPRLLGDDLRATAVIKPNENRLAHVSPRISGKAIEVRVVLGDHVEAGQVLAFLDSLELGAKKSAYLQAAANLRVARRNHEREARLHQQRISSEKEYLEAKGEFERSEAAHHAAREALRLLGLSDAAIAAIAWGGKVHPLSHFPLIAPFGGTVIAQHITVGELIRPEDHPYTIADLSTLWILLDVYEKDLGRVAVGMQADVRVDAYPEEPFAGQIAYLSYVLDERTRTARARVEIDNRSGRLRPGMFATAVIKLPSATAHRMMAIPEAALQRVHGQTIAFVEESPGIYAVRRLTLGARTGGLVVVTAGIRPGERVVTDGAFTLKSVLLKDEIAGEE